MRRLPGFTHGILTVLLALGMTVAMAQLAFFAYQGQYNHADIPSNGNLNFRFRLFNTETDGEPLAEPVYLNGVTVVDGVFDVDLPLAHLFADDPLWLEIRIEDVILPARQEVMPPN